MSKAKKKPEQSKLCSGVANGYKKDILAISDRLELSCRSATDFVRLLSVFQAFAFSVSNGSASANKIKLDVIFSRSVKA